MKLHPECISCVISRALHDAELANATLKQKMSIIKRFIKIIDQALETNMTPAELGSYGEFLIQEITRNFDPYRELKEKSTEIAQSVVNKLEIDLEPNYENFQRIVRLVTAANAIEFGIRGYESTDKILNEFEKLLKAEIAINDAEKLWNFLKQAKNVLYLLDNAGEHIFDRIFCEFIHNTGKNLIIGARKKPVLNDVTVDDAIKAGFGKIGKVVPISEIIGVLFDKVTEEFRKAWEDADLVIAKGMGAFETLTEYKHEKPVFILLKAKCIPVARELNVKQGSLVIKQLT